MFQSDAQQPCKIYVSLHSVSFSHVLETFDFNHVTYPVWSLQNGIIGV